MVLGQKNKSGSLRSHPARMVYLLLRGGVMRYAPGVAAGNCELKCSFYVAKKQAWPLSKS